MSSSNIIKKVIAKANFDFIQNILHKADNHIIERGIQAKHIYNIDETVSGHKSSIKMVNYVQVLRNMW